MESPVRCGASRVTRGSLRRQGGYAAGRRVCFWRTLNSIHLEIRSGRRTMLRTMPAPKTRERARLATKKCGGVCCGAARHSAVREHRRSLASVAGGANGPRGRGPALLRSTYEKAAGEAVLFFFTWRAIRSSEGAKDGGEGGIRTPGTLAGTRDFQSRTFDHSVTSPVGRAASKLSGSQPGRGGHKVDAGSLVNGNFRIRRFCLRAANSPPLSSLWPPSRTTLFPVGVIL